MNRRLRRTYLDISMLMIEVLDFRVIWGDSKANKSVWDRRRFIHINSGIRKFGEHSIGSVEAGGPCTDNGEAKRAVSPRGLFRFGRVELWKPYFGNISSSYQ